MASTRAAFVRLGGPALLAAAAIALLHAAAPSAQSELVIYKEGSNQYHRPGCDVIRSGEGVIALTRAQAEARGYKPHPACDPEAPKPDVKEPAAAAPPTVYVNGTKYYHRKDCRRLEANPKAVRAESLDTAGRKYWPCPDCRPPVRKRSTASEPPARGR